MKTALVTGATGFLGRNLVTFLLEKGWNVVCLVRPKSKHEHLKVDGVKLVQGDFTQTDVLRDAVSGVDVVFHLAGATAADSLEKMMEVNCVYTENLVKACMERAEKPVFVYVSSLAAAGPSTSKRPHIEDDLSAPVSWYGKSKLAAETMLRKYADEMNITVIRPPMLFGPYDHEVSIWINAIRKSGIFFIPFIRTYRFSMAHSEDVCQILYLAAEKGERLPGPENTESQSVGTGIYYVSQTEHPTYMEMGRLFGKALGRKFTLILPVTSVLVLFVCLFMNLRRKITGKHYAMSLDKFLEIMAGSWSCSADKARVQLGFQNAHTLLEQCKSTADWLKRPKS